ncbi:D-aminoacyl-tRNA deacylase [Dietzia psychralcaliphila]|uniref:D-aminoacyl-tRNA deacylase n=1 Tax=Dietzia psychralcaliphila TaxID=139021 RepID=A0AAD0NQU1_9ACTN|nr:D-aminoacyl-tRNA deacylase [Dietzia psychralcaliphila]AWH95353.1 D-tyrosyl-tRNA(Tyr) deacylase [Dietzia psychralcaliphila]PTM85481.1 D-tyrosyl-tRNA(Tyr) deacylase [Dietzia psychralcaliphila]
MRAVISRVTEASVTVDGEVVGALPRAGLLVLLGVSNDDDEADITTMVRKIAELRILRDEKGAVEIGAPVLVVSQFTLMGSTTKGRRPSWSRAAPGERAEAAVDAVVRGLRERGLEVATGVFGAMMQVSSVNDGPFTVLVETSVSTPS